ncbi:MAG: lactonase family protein [Lentisphaeria bacterium]|nr:lactonase family protein [Lentisphaeria bacterium]
MVTDKGFFFVAARSENSDGGIYTVDSRTLEVTSFCPMPSVSYLLSYPSEKKYPLLYAVGKNLDGENYVGIWSIGEKGVLTYLDQRNTHGISSCHLTTDPSGEWLYCCSYSSGNLCEFKLKDDGLFAEADARKILFTGGKLGPHTKRQEKPHPHCTVFTPDGKYLCIPDLGLDSVLLYAFSPETGISHEISFRYESVHGGAGPRHLIFSADGKKAYLANEVDNTVSVLEYADGILTHCETHSTLQGPVEKNTVAAIRFSPDGKYVCISNRGEETFALFRILENGLLCKIDSVPVHGRNPRDINFLPGNILSSCNEFTNDVTFLRYSESGTKLTFAFMEEKTLSMPGPLCVIP